MTARSRRRLLAAAAAAAVTLLAGCKIQELPVLTGAWSLTVNGVTEVWVFTGTSASVTDQDSFGVKGAMINTINSETPAAGPLQMLTTSASGTYASVPAGTQWYVTWTTDGSTLWISGGVGTYPATAVTGPFQIVP